MKLEQTIAEAVQKAILSLYQVEIEISDVQLQQTRKEFEGDITLVVFPFVKLARKAPEQVANEIGEILLNEVDEVLAYNAVKGFLNFVISDGYWLEAFNRSLVEGSSFGFKNDDSRAHVMVEYSSPNTNKPLHLGHLRNNFLGYSVAEILKANGHKVSKVQIINDRGIHICKSMLAWQKFGHGETPESTGLKGDKLVGNYYVAFDKKYKEEIADLVSKGMDKELAEKEAPIMKEAQEMLVKWEQKDEEVYVLWEKMNAWVYSGFDATYKAMGVDFDKLYYESETYIKGKEEVVKGVERGIFYTKEDGSIWVDLSDDGMDQKLLLRADGTSVYMTQDIGTAILRFEDNPDLEGIVYTVGNEQEYHFNVLFKILEKLGYEWAKNCYHLSYGMVELPSGKMKSREGTVVDADDLMLEMKETAAQITAELGKLDGLAEEEKKALFHSIGMASLKYYLLKVEPRKGMMFNPEESIDFAGNTGPFIQYTHARIKSILNKYGNAVPEVDTEQAILTQEKQIIQQLLLYPAMIDQSANEHNPAVIANYVYDLVKLFNHFYQTTPILKVDDEKVLAFRIALSQMVANVIKSGMGLLGIDVPEQM
jgi:arginyl-tRNA synthetase